MELQYSFTVIPSIDDNLGRSHIVVAKNGDMYLSHRNGDKFSLWKLKTPNKKKHILIETVQSFVPRIISCDLYNSTFACFIVRLIYDRVHLVILDLVKLTFNYIEFSESQIYRNKIKFINSYSLISLINGILNVINIKTLKSIGVIYDIVDFNNDGKHLVVRTLDDRIRRATCDVGGISELITENIHVSGDLKLIDDNLYVVSNDSFYIYNLYSKRLEHAITSGITRDIIHIFDAQRNIRFFTLEEMAFSSKSYLMEWHLTDGLMFSSRLPLMSELPMTSIINYKSKLAMLSDDHILIYSMERSDSPHKLTIGYYD